MASASAHKGAGFDFSNEVRYVRFRNSFLTDRGIPLPKATSTGTTIVGCLSKDGIILGADRRATAGPIVVTMPKQMLFRCHRLQLFTIHPRGSTYKLPYVTVGSGSLTAMAVFEANWKPNMERTDALDLVCAAISAGIFTDLGSGSNVDACVITASHTEMLRDYVKPNERVQKERTYKFRRGTTEIKNDEIRALAVEEDITYIPTARGRRAT
ncbi:proteasome subunit [Epithele typhae]|uniref:proteasome subunit n=1 Tax=Epithele typhae TaxID=378194 RepID=UPI0020082AC3|nr:proteasome subunit [Epithele typhae]KAH9914078.1 proteasome subunit [Epithele typhae]